MSDQSNDDESVGYGKPPKATRFKKGQSGNPKGRPKGARSVKSSLKRELMTKIPIREGERQTKMSKAEVLAKGLTADALKGDAKARLEILKLDDELFGESQNIREGSAPPAQPEAIDYDILRDFFLNLETSDDGDDNDST